jgi:hypothetical protein
MISRPMLTYFVHMTKKQNWTQFSIWGFHSSSYEEFYLLAYNAVQSVEKSTNVSEEHITSNFRDDG